MPGIPPPKPPDRDPPVPDPDSPVTTVEPAAMLVMLIFSISDVFCLVKFKSPVIMASILAETAYGASPMRTNLKPTYFLDLHLLFTLWYPSAHWVQVVGEFLQVMQGYSQAMQIPSVAPYSRVHPSVQPVQI